MIEKLDKSKLSNVGFRALTGEMSITMWDKINEIINHLNDEKKEGQFNTISDDLIIAKARIKELECALTQISEYCWSEANQAMTNGEEWIEPDKVIGIAKNALKEG